MTPAKLDLTIYRGSTFVKEITWQTGTPAAAVNLTGCKIQMQMRPKIAETNIIDELTTENGRIVITDAAAGKFTISVPASVSTGYLATYTNGVYDLEVVMPDLTTIYRIIEGKVTIVAEVTR